jgi:hypothetical protein
MGRSPSARANVIIENLPLPRQKKFFSCVVTGSSIVVISIIIRFLPGACRLEFNLFLFIRKICPFTICPPIFLVKKSARAKSTDCHFLPIGYF